MINQAHEIELRRYVSVIPNPETAHASAEERRLVTRWFEPFQTCSPPITALDVMGLIVARMTHEFSPKAS